jgi:hypothetical protein
MTTPDNDWAELAVAVGEMNKTAVGLRGEVADLKVYGRRNRHLIWIVAISVALDLFASSLAIYGLIRANDAQNKANAAQVQANDATARNCQASNASRKDISDLWSQVLPLLARTDAEQTLKIKDYISTAYAQRDCSKVTK